MKSTKFLVGIFAALVLVAGGMYGIQRINAGENCAAHATATADKGDAKVETANATAAGCCAAKAGTVDAEHANATMTSAGCCAAKTGTVSAEKASATGSCPSMAGTVNAEHAGAQCTYNAKTASAQCTSADKANLTKADGAAELMTAEATMAKLSHCGIDCRKVDAQVLASKLTGSGCGTYTQEQWTSMIKSAQALDAKQLDAIFASATSEKPCAGDACPMKKVAADLAAAQSEEKKASSN